MRVYLSSFECKLLIPVGLCVRRGAGGISSGVLSSGLLPSFDSVVTDFGDSGTASDDEEFHWWAMSAVYNRSLQASSFFSSRNIEHYVPLRTVLLDSGGRKVRREIPAVANLIFVRCTTAAVKSLKAELPYLQYLTLRETGFSKGRPIRIPNDDMSAFMAVSSAGREGLLYFRPEELDLSRGRRVRLHGGALDGVEATFLKVTGARERRVVVMLEGVLAVAAQVRPDFVEVIE